MKQPNECQSLQDIRIAIDQIDAQIITALGSRLEYVKAAAAFKTNQAHVSDPERLSSMLAQRRVWAEAAGLDPDWIETVFRDLVSYFIQAELQQYQQGRSS